MSRLDAQDQKISQLDMHNKDTHTKVTEALARLEVLESEWKVQSKETKQMEKRIERAEVAVPARVAATGFERPPNPTRLKVNIENGRQATMESVLAAIVGEVLPGASVPKESVVLEGDDVSDRFMLQFSGLGQIPVAAAAQVLRSLRLGKGKWKPVYTKDGEAQMRVYIGEDLGPRLEKLGLLTKRLGAVFKELS